VNSLIILIDSVLIFYLLIALLLNQDFTNEINKNFAQVAKTFLEFEGWDDLDELDSVMMDMKDSFFGNETINKKSETRFNLTNMISDR
jgi:hypothetical protein